jgi:hypothetical protein
MSVYDLHFNKDDSTIRNILVGLLATLHDNVYWYNQIGTKVGEKRKIKIPFYFSTTGTERYLQDNFLNNIDFDPDLLEAETSYNSIPRAIVNLEGINIEGSSIVNKYVRMNYQVQEEDGTLNTYNAEAFWVPLLLNVKVTVYLDSILDQLKCTEALIKTFFKNKTFQVDNAYTRIPSVVTFPEDYTNERNMEFGFTDKKEFKVDFSLDVKSFLPVFKEGTEIFAGNIMETFEYTTFVEPVNYGPDGPFMNKNNGSTAINTNRGINPSGFTGNYQQF